MLQFEEAIIPEFITGIVFSIIIFIVGIYVTRWFARKKGWDDSLLTAFIVNIIWQILSISIIIFFSFMFGINLLIYFIELVIIIVIGTVVVKIVYKKEFGESFVFVLVVLPIYILIGTLILFIISVILEIFLRLLILIFY